MYNVRFKVYLWPASIIVHCPRCQSALVYRHGAEANAATACFNSITHSEARKLGIKKLITEMAFDGSGVRDTAWTLKVGINTVIQTLKNSRHDE